MVGVVSRESYFATGLEILADLGYGGLKLAEVCGRLGVTTGSFYHYFPNWPAYTKDLVAHWMQRGTMQAVESARVEADPRERVAILIQVGLSLPHGSEAAIRVWSSMDPHVHEVQVAVDQQRLDVLYEAAFEILRNQRRAQVFASWGLYLLVGYEQATVPSDPAALAWIAGQWLASLESGVFDSLPDGD
jgi:AcrR family transcriptional regulator